MSSSAVAPAQPRPRRRPLETGRPAEEPDHLHQRRPHLRPDRRRRRRVLCRQARLPDRPRPRGAQSLPLHLPPPCRVALRRPCRHPSRQRRDRPHRYRKSIPRSLSLPARSAMPSW
jgi:hypothetical protein